MARTLEAALEADPVWTEQSLGTLLTRGQAAPLPGRRWRTMRSRARPQDLDPLIAAIADRLAIRGSPPHHWHHTDPLNPSSPLPAGRTIVSVYDAIPLQEPGVWRTIRPHRRAAYRRYLDLARASSGVIASLASTALDIEAAVGIPRDRIAVVPPYVRRLVAGPSGPTASSADAARRFLFVGVLEAHKRPELAVGLITELARRGESATLTFIDARPAQRRQALERHVSALGLADRIRFVDRLDDAALDAIYSGSTLLATSRVEGFGQPPVEAILAGGRVLAVPIPAYLETVSGMATFAAAATPDSLADAAMTTADGPDETSRAVLATRFSAAGATDALRTAYDRFGVS